jgi:hypothetical protein
MEATTARCHWRLAASGWKSSLEEKAPSVESSHERRFFTIDRLKPTAPAASRQWHAALALVMRRPWRRFKAND